MIISNIKAKAQPTLNLVPENPREAVREAFDLPEAMSMADLMKTSDWATLVREYKEELADNDHQLKPLEFDDVEQASPKFDLRDFWIDFVDQRDRLKSPIYRKAIIDMAINFSVKDADIPTGRKPKDVKKENQVPYLSDWQKRCLGLLLRGVTHYEARIVWTKLKELASDFNSQFKRKDNIKQYDKFKTDLAEEKPKQSAMQECFERLQLTVYPWGDPPLLTGLTDVTQAMFNPKLNSAEHKLSLDEMKFTNFVRAVGVFRTVWPTLAKTSIPGSFIRGLTAVIASLDKNVLKGSDAQLVTILLEAKKDKYELYKEDNAWVGISKPFDWTNWYNWQGNRFHQNAITSVAKAWNKILRVDRKLRKINPELDPNPIIALEESDAKFLDLTKK